MEIADELKHIDENLVNQLYQIAKDKIEYRDIRAGVHHGTHLDFIDKKSKEISTYEITECGIRTFFQR